MSSKPAAIPLFADAYLADTMHLTTEEHGAYLLLLMAAWRQDDCSLPNDDRKLARITGLSARKWTAIKPTVLEFWTVENGSIFQARLRKERTYVSRRGEANRENARKRWSGQDAEIIGDGRCDRISDGISDGNAPPPPPPPIEEPNGSSSQARERRDECDEVFDAWRQMASSIGLEVPRKLSDKRRTACRARLREEGREAIIRAIEHVPRSAFLRGDRGDWGGATIDFLLRPDSVTKILEGRYDDRPSQPPHAQRDTRDGLTRRLHEIAGIGDATEPSGASRRPPDGDGGGDRELPLARAAAHR